MSSDLGCMSQKLDIFWIQCGSTWAPTIYWRILTGPINIPTCKDFSVWWPEWMVSLPPYCQIFRIFGFVDPSLPICHEAWWVFHKLAGPVLVKRAHRRQSGFEKAAHQFTSNINAVSPPRPLHLSQLQLSLRRQILNTQILCLEFQWISTISLNHGRSTTWVTGQGQSNT